MKADSRSVLEQHRRGQISDEVALARLLLAHGSVAAVRRVLGERGSVALLRVLDSRTGADALLARVEAVVREANQAASRHGADAADAAEAVSRTAALFDRCVAHSEEASVALYSLGSPERLERATGEIVALFERWQLLDRTRAALDFGCGVGRVALALSPRLGEVHGVDVSTAMIERARRRCAGAENVRLEVGSGLDLAGFGDARFDLVYAVDSFPYLVLAAADLVHAIGREAARVLRRGGELVVLNWSYRADPALDGREARAIAGQNGLDLLACGERPLALWDAAAYRFRRV
ncbi:MAG TPA: class I SAM-dependent methyltransferase [Polyangiaceae bacterium]|nr:class I SAM-dependent methyltransferase [Polyangiaceae bacterium]